MQMPTLSRDGVVLREWNDDDIGVVMAVADDPLIPLISSVPTVADPASARAYVDRQRSRAPEGIGWAFAVAPSIDSPASGFVGVMWRDREEGRASIGYWAGPSARKLGLTTRAVALATDWAIEQPGLERLEAYIEPWNTGSIKVAEGAGFEKEGLMRSFAPVGGRRMDALLYARVAPDRR